jgi:hypothetical protein
MNISKSEWHVPDSARKRVAPFAQLSFDRIIIPWTYPSQVWVSFASGPVRKRVTPFAQLSFDRTYNPMNISKAVCQGPHLSRYLSQRVMQGMTLCVQINPMNKFDFNLCYLSDSFWIPNSCESSPQFLPDSITQYNDADFFVLQQLQKQTFVTYNYFICIVYINHNYLIFNINYEIIT